MYMYTYLLVCIYYMLLGWIYLSDQLRSLGLQTKRPPSHIQRSLVGPGCKLEPLIVGIMKPYKFQVPKYEVSTHNHRHDFHVETLHPPYLGTLDPPGKMTSNPPLKTQNTTFTSISLSTLKKPYLYPPTVARLRGH